MYDFEGDFETIYTGEIDSRLSGLIDKYNGNSDLPQWAGKCANVNGASDGTKFRSYIQPNDTLLFFRKSLCRSIKLVISVRLLQSTSGKSLTSLSKNFQSSHAIRLQIVYLLLTFHLLVLSILVNCSYDRSSL